MQPRQSSTHSTHESDSDRSGLFRHFAAVLAESEGKRGKVERESARKKGLYQVSPALMLIVELQPESGQNGPVARNTLPLSGISHHSGPEYAATYPPRLSISYPEHVDFPERFCYFPYRSKSIHACPQMSDPSELFPVWPGSSAPGQIWKWLSGDLRHGSG